MKLKFDSNLQFQMDAINSIVDIFDGQPLGKADFAIEINTSSVGLGQRSIIQTELGIGNNLILSNEKLYENIEKIQDRNELDTLSFEEFETNGLNFSVEMETGTGKTYVYLRTIYELSQKYGFKKFIVVVPSIAIREGTLKNIDITKDHFRAIYNNIEFEHFVYDSKRAERLRQFATSNQIQIMIINIDAFKKDFSDSEEDRRSNVIFKESDKLSGRKPIEFVQATRPIVIIDEPQSVDKTPKAQEAIKSLNPLFILRYSATHINKYNLVYKLDPIKAFKLNLVKQIVVASARSDNTFNNAYVKFVEVDNSNGIRAKLIFHKQTNSGPKEQTMWVKQNSDLFSLSNERECYRSGFEVQDISAEPGNEYVEFSNLTLYLGQENGGIKDDLMKIQIRNTIKKHLDKELMLKDKGIKVLSLFFVDKVANYRIYDSENKPQQGKFAIWFEESYKELISNSHYASLDVFDFKDIHDGYFSVDNKGILKDTRGESKDDETTYDKIMKNKEKLLSLDEPLKFIFSHSALKEGWDNPNVFQICTLNESRSTLRKRQEIGRGLRLPVNQNGERVFDKDINKLFVVANESYDEFARTLQTEYEKECGVTFGKVPKNSFSSIISWNEDKEQVLGKEKSEKIWNELISNGILDNNGKILSKFNPSQTGFSIGLSEEFSELEDEIVTILESYEMSRHIRKDEEPKTLKLKKHILIDNDFIKLWDKIKYKTTYAVQLKSEKLIDNCVNAIKQMEKIEPIVVNYREDMLDIDNRGVSTSMIKSNKIRLEYTGQLPDIITYLQKETELTRQSLIKILSESKRLMEFAHNPQKYMDAIGNIINTQLHQLIIDGIKYQRISDQEYRMELFEENEIVTYLNERIDVNKSIYDAVKFDSEIERKFAEELDQREDIKLFVKLPEWFKIETPIGKYNPDWAILKTDETVLYLVRETKGTKNFEHLRSSEAYKIRCGRRHFEELKVNYDVVVHAIDI